MDSYDILYLTEKDGLLPEKNYKVLQVFMKSCGGPVYFRQRICELTPELSPDEAATKKKPGAKSGAKSGKSSQRLVIKSAMSGTIKEILVKKDQTVTLGSNLIRLSACKHPTMLGNTCGDCGVTIEMDDDDMEQQGQDPAQVKHTVSMLHSMPNLKVSMEEAKQLGAADRVHLLDSRKLVLLVDLDQTLIHTTNDPVPAAIKDVYHFRLHPHGPVYHSRLRPYTRQFLQKMSALYELHICTFGVREYAHVIAKYLDPHGDLFEQRILSRNECLDPMSKKANLKSLFPCGDDMVCIMDDRSDVWHFAPNVVQVLPYHFFQHTGDINAPPGLQKRENDSRQKGFDFTTLETSVKEKLKQRERLKLTPDANESKAQEDNSSSGIYSYSDDDTTSLDSDDNTRTVDSAKPNTETVTEQTALVETNVQQGSTKEQQNDNAVLNEQISDCDPEKCSEKNGTTEEATKTETGTKEADPEQVQQVESHQTDPPVVEAEGTTDLQEKENLPKSDDLIEVKLDKDEKVKDETSLQDSKKYVKFDEKSDESKLNDINVHDDSKSQDAKLSPDDVIDVPDNDDYLLHLEDILEKIHTEFYLKYKPFKLVNQRSKLPARKYTRKGDNKQANNVEDTASDADVLGDDCPGDEDTTGSGFLPDLKHLIPEIRGKVLKGCNIVFSNVIPQRVDIQTSKAYSIAVCLGAWVTKDLVLHTNTPSNGGGDEGPHYTTHLVAANRHTEKVHMAIRSKTVKVVTPDWLWCCMERWDNVDERLFPLDSSTVNTLQRNPPHHCCQPSQFLSSSRQNSRDLFIMEDKAKRSMMEEVDELMGSDDSNGEDDSNNSSALSPRSKASKRSHDEANANDQVSSSSSDSCLDSGAPDAARRRTKRRKKQQQEDFEKDPRRSNGFLGEECSEDDELPSVKFRRGEALSSSDDSNDSDLEELDSAEEERLMKMEQELMDL